MRRIERMQEQRQLQLPRQRQRQLPRQRQMHLGVRRVESLAADPPIRLVRMRDGIVVGAAAALTVSPCS
jgi:hypothetical protein